MQNRSGDKIRLKHILDAILEIDSYTFGIGHQEFMTNSMLRFACIKQLEIVGEASNHISNDLKAEFLEIEWAQIVGMRNVFAHEYFGIDSILVWEIIINDIPELKEKIILILNKMN